LRVEKKSGRPSNFEDGKLLQEIELESKSQWTQVAKVIRDDFQVIRKQMDVLSAAHDKHLQPTSFDFDESIEDEHAIEVLTEKVTKSFKRSQEKIISLGDYKITEDEESVRKNIKSQLATELQDLSVKFRKLQQGYLKKIKIEGKKYWQIKTISRSI